jgi:drug/metabolite transporter (DMT)-like permease
MLGMIALVVGAIIQAFGLISIRRYGEHIHPVTLNLWPMAMSSLPLFAASYAIEEYSKIVYNQQSVGSLLYLALFCTVITFVIYFWLVKHVEAVILSLSAFITPVIAVIIGVLLLREVFTGTMIIGSILVLIGVAVATLNDLVTLYHRRTVDS